MDTKSLHRKHPKKMKSIKDKHEVFVLPPDLLKKLGISIGNMNASQVIPPDVSNLPNTEISNNKSMENIPGSTYSQKPLETSILETASLMKKSVFLSPTFIPTIANVIPGEVEILSKNNVEDSFIPTNLEESQTSVFIPEDTSKVIDLPAESNDVQEECFKFDPNKPSSNTTVNGVYKSVSNINEGNPNMLIDENEIQEADMLLCERLSEIERKMDNVHRFENETLLKNSCNVETDGDRDSPYISSNDVNIENPAPKSSKINIISEETIPLSKLRELKKSQFSNIKNLTPVTVHTIIDTKTNNENSNSDRQSTINQNLTVPLKNIEILHLDELKSEENVNKSKPVESNELKQAIVVPSVNSLAVIEDNIRKLDIAPHVIVAIPNLKHISEYRHQEKESCDQDNKLLNENKIVEVTVDCQLNGDTAPSADNMSVNCESVHGFDGKEDAKDIVIDTVTSVMTSENFKGQIDDDTNHEVVPSKNEIDIRHGCYEDNVKKSTDPEKEKAIQKNSKIKDGIKPKNEENRTLQHNELASMLNETKNLSSSNADIKVDKVKEIAAYLRKFSHIYTDKKKTKTALSNDNNKKESINSNINMIESKLCIQGVEKPGGKDIDSEHAGDCKVLKTYTRRNPPKTSKLSTPVLHKTETSNAVDAQNHDIQAVNISIPNGTQRFCLCCDFGRLAYYDCDDLYEHIHFWHHNTTNCEIDLIFSIYSDQASVESNETGLEQEEEEKTDDNDEACNVCWNIFTSEYSDNVDNSVIDMETNELKDASSEDTPHVAELNNIAQKINTPEAHDQIRSKNSFNFDINLETIDHDKIVDEVQPENCGTITDIEKPFSIKCNENISTAMVTAADSDCIKPNNSTLHPNLTVRRDSDTKDKASKNQQSISNANKIPRKSGKLDLPKTVDKNAIKRKLSNAGSIQNSDEPSLKKNIKCGICNNLFCAVDWDSHVDTQHNLIAWRAGGFLNLDDPELKNKLKERLKSVGILKCSVCSMEIKKFNRFMEHIKYCIKKKISNPKQKTDKPTRKSRIVTDENVTCGVCQKTMQSSNWLEHSGRNHDYLAWIDGQDTLNLDNESEVWQHLQNIIRLNGRLTCYKCGLNRSRVKLYLAHIKACDGSGRSLDETSTSVELDSTNIQEDSVEQSPEAGLVKCAVCNNDVTDSEWIEHIAKEHNYLAWRDGDTPLDLEEEESVWNHLQQFIRQHGGLTCHKCGLVRKRVKLYLTHIEMCDGTGSQVDNSLANSSMNTTTQSTDDWFEVPVVTEERKVVKCGVCSQEVPILGWIQHIGKEHDYLAWRDGTRPLNLEDSSAVKLHLLDISRQSGGLTCNKCEKTIKYPKTYLQHIKECTGTPASLDASKLDTSETSWIESFSKDKVKDEIFTCGVCASKVESAEWIQHIEMKHRYVAWVDGEPPIDRDDTAMVQRHLNDVSKMLGGLVCVKCGIRRKYVKSYLAHVDICEGKCNNVELSGTLMSQDAVECAICSEKMEPKAWRSHAMKKHYNIAWVVGDNPIELNNPYVVESYLKEYHHANNKLVCKVCGISRVSYVGFYAHIIVCGKTEEETEMYKSVCDICHNKYLRIYKSQHMTVHREKEYAMERKLLVAREKELKKEEPLEVIQTGRRKAAEKAKTVIEKYKIGLQDGSNHCSKCGFNSDNEKELSNHVCVENKWGDASDSDESVKLENCSDDDSDESDIDSNVSDEERQKNEQVSHKKKRPSDSSSAAICRLPYQIKSISHYMKRSTEEFIETYLTDEDIFTQWRYCEIEEVPESEVVNYMPPIEESCKVRFDDNGDWVTFKQLESDRVKDTIVMFMGASIQCMSWAPAAAGERAGGAGGAGMFLGAASHRRADLPRLPADDTQRGPGLLQIWDCGNVIAGSPRFVLGLAHDFGTVWAMDWCPSGARDMADFVPEPNRVHRLGLLAAACSSGSAYVFVIPYPSSLPEKEKPFYKLKPVAELRLTSNENRKVYQATAIKWSMQKGHSNVVVGYADGTTAYYDLNGDSPLLRITDNDLTVFYPYHDERVVNSCIEDVDMYPSGAGAAARAGGAVCAGGAGGAGAAALQSHVATARVLYPPHWPAALLSGEECLVNQSVNELEWWGGGRRLGGARGAAGCAWCGRVVAAAPPLLRLLRLHPCFPDVHKQVVAKIQMIPFGTKRKRQNDELAMIVEPITYSDSVKKYGIEFKQITARDKTTQQKLSSTPRDTYPERYPLSDVTAMQFCPTFNLHHKLAVAMHAGLVFIVNV